MKKDAIYTCFGIILVMIAILAVPVRSASARIQSGISTSILGYHGGSHRIWSRFDGSSNKKYTYHNGIKYDRSRLHKHKHDYEYYGFTRRPPYGTQKIKVNNIVYRYQNGVFYRKCKRGYDIVPAPKGALVRRLPSNARKSFSLGKKHYYHDGNYYQKVRKGYKIIEKPRTDFRFHDNDNYLRYSSSKHDRKCR